MASSSRSARAERPPAGPAAARPRPDGRDAGALPRADELAVIGRVVGVHGLRGEVRVRPETDFPERFAWTRDAFLVLAGVVEPTVIAGARRHGDVVLLRLEGVKTVDAARRLRGAAIAVRREALLPLPPATFYIHEILGLAVRTQDGRLLGVVREVLRGPGNDVYVVRGPAGEVLIPALREVVRAVDREAREMVVVLPPGLEAPGAD